MKDLIIKELEKGLNYREKILLKVFVKIFVKIYKKGIEKGANAIL